MLSRRSCFFLKVLLNKYQRNPTASSLLNILPEDLAKQLLEVPCDSKDAAAALAAPEEEIEKIHYSWLLEPLETYPDSLRPWLLASLSKHHFSGICQVKALVSKKRSVAPVVRQFFLRSLYYKIDGIADSIPEGFLKKQPLSILLEVNRPLLLEAIDLLGLYDLAVKIKCIVDKNQLQSITSCLSPSKRKFLKMLTYQPDRVQMPELDLSDWQGDAGKLHKILHRRGLVRLSRALSGYSDDFFWHFFHRLDTGRAKLIQKYRVTERNVVTDILAEQVLYIINTLTQKSPQ